MGIDAIIGDTPPIRQLKRIIERVAETDGRVLITGANGSGKELVARAIHELSPRKDAPFIAINCGAIPEALIESELFGHRKGAFTGASADKIGLFSHAREGTIFLDEIGELPLPLQPKLLRVLESKEFCRVGCIQNQKLNARVLAATNMSLEAMIEAGKFREDLYYRLNVIEVMTPPLCKRVKDIPLLVHAFSPERKFSEMALHLLASRKWPGNVRELRNVVERLKILSENDVVSGEDVCEHLGVDEVTKLKVENEVLRRELQNLLNGRSDEVAVAAEVLIPGRSEAWPECDPAAPKVWHVNRGDPVDAPPHGDPTRYYTKRKDLTPCRCSHCKAAYMAYRRSRQDELVGTQVADAAGHAN